MLKGVACFATVTNFRKFLKTVNGHNFVEYGWIFKIQKLADGEKSGESITINFNNVNAFAHVLEQKVFFGKLAISQKLEDISKCCQKDFLSVQKLKNILLKAQFHILTISRTVCERVNTYSDKLVQNGVSSLLVTQMYLYDSFLIVLFAKVHAQVLITR